MNAAIESIRGATARVALLFLLAVPVPVPAQEDIPVPALKPHGAVLEAARVAIQERALFPPAPKALATAKHPTELVAALREAGDPFADYLPPAELADIEAPRLGGFGIALSALGDGLLTGR